MGSVRAIQVRLWRTERTKDEILRFMRISGSEELMNQRQDMIAYWDFNEPDDDRQATRTALQQPAALNDASQYRCRRTECSSSPPVSGAVLASARKAGVPSTSVRQSSCLKPLQVRPLRAPVVCPAWHLMGR